MTFPKRPNPDTMSQAQRDQHIRDNYGEQFVGGGANNATASQEPRPVEEMTDREIQIETLQTLRMFGAAVQQFQAMGPAAILKTVMSGKR